MEKNNEKPNGSHSVILTFSVVSVFWSGVNVNEPKLHTNYGESIETFVNVVIIPGTVIHTRFSEDYEGD